MPAKKKSFCYFFEFYTMQVLKQREYKAEPADIWSCGIVLTAMLAGGMNFYMFMSIPSVLTLTFYALHLLLSS